MQPEPFIYRTKKGSEVGFTYNQPSDITFDWFEEDNACDACEPSFEETTKRKLVWICEHCDGGCAPLKKCKAR